MNEPIVERVTEYQCNLCGKVHLTRIKAIKCHPDINEVQTTYYKSRGGKKIATVRGDFRHNETLQ